MAFNCVSCGRPLYNRRRKNCEFCGTPLAGWQRLSPEQQAALQRMKDDEAKEHRESMRQPYPGTFGSDFPNFWGD